MVVGLPPGMSEFESSASHLDLDPVAVGEVRFGDVVGQESAGLAFDADVWAHATELTPVDGEVPAVGAPVALEAGRDGFVRHHPRSGMAPGLCVGDERPAAAHVVEVAVGVDERVDRVVGPVSECLDHHSTRPGAAGIDADQALVGAQGPAV